MSFDPAAQSLFQSHPRSFEENQYVYPVLSRRAGGISIGVNLNIAKNCNFDCIYCQVERSNVGGSRTAPTARHRVDVSRLADELWKMVEETVTGRLFIHPRFCDTPPNLRRLNDIALSGDGEPTLCGDFGKVVERCAVVQRAFRSHDLVRRTFGLHDFKLVLITTATMLHRKYVQRGLELLDAHHGEIWAKLDAGTEAYYRQVNRSGVSFDQVLTNLREAARIRPIVIQSLFMRIDGTPRAASPTIDEQEAFCCRLSDLIAAGGQIKLVQVHTVARAPAERWVTPLTNAEIDSLADLIRCRTSLDVAAYHA